MKRWLIWLIVALLLALGLYWAYLKFYRPASQPGNGEQTPTQSGETVERSITGTSYSFTPSTITVPAGSKVRLTFTNSGTIQHNFTIPSLGVNTTLVAPGKSETIEFTAPSQTGSFEFICSVPGHADLGMKGTLKVE